MANKITKKEITKEIKLGQIWNRVKTYKKYTLAGVMWHNKPWKIIKTGEIFENITPREYEPIQEFRTQAELLTFLYNDINNINKTIIKPCKNPTAKRWHEKYQRDILKMQQ